MLYKILSGAGTRPQLSFFEIPTACTWQNNATSDVQHVPPGAANNHAGANESDGGRHSVLNTDDSNFALRAIRFENARSLLIDTRYSTLSRTSINFVKPQSHGHGRVVPHQTSYMQHVPSGAVGSNGSDGDKHSALNTENSGAFEPYALKTYDPCLMDGTVDTAHCHALSFAKPQPT